MRSAVSRRNSRFSAALRTIQTRRSRCVNRGQSCPAHEAPPESARSTGQGGRFPSRKEATREQDTSTLATHTHGTDRFAGSHPDAHTRCCHDRHSGQKRWYVVSFPRKNTDQASWPTITIVYNTFSECKGRSILVWTMFSQQYQQTSTMPSYVTSGH